MDHQLITINTPLLTRVWILLLSVWLITSCSINPATGTPDLVFMSEAEEIKMGAEMHEKMLKSVPIYADEKLTAYVNQIGQTVAKHSDRPNLNYHFTIIDSPDINAFALPGGYIYVNRGLLVYLDSEAQLAAVLAHEIGHVTARHVVRQDTARKGASVLSVLSVFTTGSMVVGDATSLFSTAAVQGYGRDMELEADGLGAKYLFNTGYDPHAMVETIGVLKDQEKFARFRAKEEGKKSQSYHGVFSSHPRNDVRLKEVIAAAGELPDNHTNITNKESYREQTEGLVYGINFDAEPQPKSAEPNRYHHHKLGFSFLYPEGWQVENSQSAIISVPENKHAEIKLQVALREQNISPGDYLRRVSNAAMLLRSEDFAQYGLIGHTGIISSTDKTNAAQHDQRVAVFYQGNRAYLMMCSVTLPEANIDYDALFLTSIQSFRPEQGMVRKAKSKTIHYVKANERTSIELLAKQLNIGLYAEQQLRLINGLYPRGEPKPGDWLKIIH
jgi:predicted Zn-dependent protease